jgi:hypothetical protein
MPFFAGSTRAGAYAERRYKRGLTAYRSRARLILTLFLGPFIVVGLVGLAIDGHLAAWSAGVAFGLGAGAFVVLRDLPPAYVETWQIGGAGERKTEQALKSLASPTWLVVHDVECARGNYDHIVVGRAGVFLLETKNLRGIVHMVDGEPHLRRRSDPEADRSCAWIRSSALAGAASLKEEIQRRTGRRLWVQAVVVLWSEFEEGLDEQERCVFVHGSSLNKWISAQPDTWDQTQADQLVAAVQAIAADAGAGDSVDRARELSVLVPLRAIRRSSL